MAFHRTYELDESDEMETDNNKSMFLTRVLGIMSYVFSLCSIETARYELI